MLIWNALFANKKFHLAEKMTGNLWNSILRNSIIINQKIFKYIDISKLL